MKKIILVTAAAFLATTAVLAQDATQTGATMSRTHAPQDHVLSREEFDKLLAHPGKLLLIDVRRPDEISKIGGLPVYLNVQLDELEKSAAWIPKERTVVTLSNHAVRAARAADFLRSKGFKVAGAVGVQTYEQQGGTLTKVAIPTSRARAATATDQPQQVH
jgi:rhodanese-related sulfurtransferase